AAGRRASTRRECEEVQTMSRRVAAAVAGGAILLCMGGAAHIAAAHTLTLTDLRNEVGISDPRFAPNGRDVVYVESRSDFEGNATTTKLMLIDTGFGATHALTRSQTGISSPRWSPDGAQLAFLADADADAGDSAGSTQLFVMPATGGESRQVTHAHEGVESYAWRPDGNAFA